MSKNQNSFPVEVTKKKQGFKSMDFTISKYWVRVLFLSLTSSDKTLNLSELFSLGFAASKVSWYLCLLPRAVRIKLSAPESLGARQGPARNKS